MWDTVIAVIGTLAGGLLTGLLSARYSTAQRREDAAAARREAQLVAVTRLVEALTAHRGAMWDRELMRLDGVDGERLEKARETIRSTRAALAAPVTTVEILSPALAHPTKAAEAAAFALRNATDHDALAELRQAARDSVDQLVTAASRILA